MWIVRTALDRPYTFVVLALLILILSPLVILATPTDIFPNINIPVVAIAWQYTGLDPEVSVFGNQNKGKYWDLYSEMFAGLTQRPPDGFPHAYTETFAKAYEAKVRAALPPRRNVFGGADERGADQHGDSPGGDALAAGDN